MSTLIWLSPDVQVLAHERAVHVSSPAGSFAEDEKAGPLLLRCRRPQRLEDLRAEYDPDLLDRLLANGVLVPWGDDEACRLHAATLHGPTVAGTPGSAGEWTDDARLVREYASPDPVPLPDPLPVRGQLVDLLARRRSARTFGTTAVYLAQLATVLSTALGVGTDRPVLPRAQGAPPARPGYPSPGALYPVEIGILAWDIVALPPGAYHYQPFPHRLSRLGVLDAHTATYVLPEHPTTQAAALVVLWVDLRSASVAKYGPKAYRLALLEAGHVMQNLVLVTTALGLGALPAAGFRDTELGDLLGLVATEQVPVYALLLGSDG